jgi:hypothetical protein
VIKTLPQKNGYVYIYTVKSWRKLHAHYLHEFVQHTATFSYVSYFLFTILIL